MGKLHRSMPLLPNRTSSEFHFLLCIFCFILRLTKFSQPQTAKPDPLSVTIATESNATGTAIAVELTLRDM